MIWSGLVLCLFYFFVRNFYIFVSWLNTTQKGKKKEEENKKRKGKMEIIF